MWPSPILPAIKVQQPTVWMTSVSSTSAACYFPDLEILRPYVWYFIDRRRSVIQMRQLRAIVCWNALLQVLLRKDYLLRLTAMLDNIPTNLHTVTNKLTVWVRWPPVRAPPNWEIWTAGRSAAAECLLTEGTKTHRQTVQNKFPDWHSQISFLRFHTMSENYSEQSNRLTEESLKSQARFCSLFLSVKLEFCSLLSPNACS